MRSFVTGSRVYGPEIKPESDTDLVILVSPEDALILKSQANSVCGKDWYEIKDGIGLRFDNLNLVCLTKEEDFMAWKLATLHCCAHPRKKTEIVQVFKGYLQVVKDGVKSMLGVSDKCEVKPDKDVQVVDRFRGALDEVCSMLKEAGDERTAVLLEKAFDLLQEKVKA